MSPNLRLPGPVTNPVKVQAANCQKLRQPWNPEIGLTFDVVGVNPACLVRGNSVTPRSVSHSCYPIWTYPLRIIWQKWLILRQDSQSGTAFERVLYESARRSKVCKYFPRNSRSLLLRRFRHGGWSRLEKMLPKQNRTIFWLFNRILGRRDRTLVRRLHRLVRLEGTENRMLSLRKFRER